MTRQKSSRIPGFYKFPLVERTAMIAQWAGLSREEQAVFFGMTGLSLNDANHIIENVIGTHALPFAIATNFMINQQDYLIPMVIEESSVVAAVSNAARLIRTGGGFATSATDPVMIGQIQIMDLPDVWEAARIISENRDLLLSAVNDPNLTIVKRGGGARDIETRPFEETAAGPMLVVHLMVDVQDAMGANIVNTMCEQLAPIIESLIGGRAGLRILSNLSDQRLAAASCRIPSVILDTENYSGEEVAANIIEAAVFAEVDPYRATTHNKGIMNGIDAVAIATGNDWRAIEAGAHAFASRQGRYTSLTQWWLDEDGDLCGQIQLPLAVGLVGGITKIHPTVRVALKILDVQSSTELAEVMACVGLAQNFAAIRALATEGIQRGHMSMHARQVAMAAGAQGDQVKEIAQIMIEEQNIRVERARELLSQMGG